MRKFILLLSALAVAAFIGGTAYAGHTEEHVVTGEVVAIDSLGKTIVVRTGAGEKTFVFQETTEGFKDVKPGMAVEMTCIDVEGKSCAKIIKPAKVGPSRTVTGKVVSIDPEGKTVVIKTPAGEEVKMEVKAEEAVMVKPAMKPAAGEEMMMAEPMPMSEVKPGMEVKLDCLDSGEKFCANRVTVVSTETSGKPVKGFEVVGEVVAIDSTNKTVVIKTTEEPKTLYYQKVTTGLPFGSIEMGKKVRAYCLDIEGHSCVQEITPAEVTP